MLTSAICIPAHNEEKQIGKTVTAIVQRLRDEPTPIRVYANGCTDGTADRVLELQRHYPQVTLRQIFEASKAVAWRQAVLEAQEDVIIFADADIEPQENSLQALVQAFVDDPELVLCGCQFWPTHTSLSLEQKFFGFIQIPLVHDFLSGGLYAFRRAELCTILAGRDGKLLPDGVVAEDTFLENRVPKKRQKILANKVHYTPPDFADYCKYLARLQWQNEQLALFYDSMTNGGTVDKTYFGGRLKTKISNASSSCRFLLGLVAWFGRVIFKLVFRKQIRKELEKLGPVAREGGSILASKTRSTSTR